MPKKYQFFYFSVTCFLVFIIFGFFCLITSRAYAADAGLEVEYPKIYGKTVTSKTTLPGYVEYLFNAGMFLGFLGAFVSLIIAGVMFFLSPIKPDLRASAKDRVSGAISGILILALTYLIITTINPQLNILRFNEPAAVQETEEKEEERSPGIYFYDKSDCPTNNIQPYALSIRDLGALKNKINSVAIEHDVNNETLYVSILYTNTDFWGKCQYLNPNEECQKVDPFASSASIYEYDVDPNGDGVYFYRKPCFNEQGFSNVNAIVAYCNEMTGGYYKISNDEIRNDESDSIFVAKLDSLKFTDVPKDQWDCVKYDRFGRCAENGREKPTLGGENISSVIINGDYLVLFVYRAQNDKKYGPWTSCQEFPTVSDINRFGPQQIKWQNIRNSGGVVPNYVIILPIKND